ncbi:hypothetical protein I3843_12G119000 [Carya illinoinensis]|nr:hypothetical protein I3843_12G119000 [Carya illinoinensis]
MFLPFSQRKPHQEIALRSPSTEWVRGEPVGHGSFATVNLAIPRNGSTHASPLMVVKSSESSCSVSLKSEKQVLDQLSTCPQVIRCLGEDRSVENGEELYNLFLEGASHGSLADQLKNRGGSLPESDVRRYVKSVIKGLRDVHARGFVHCDIKLQNREAIISDGCVSCHVARPMGANGGGTKRASHFPIQMVTKPLKTLKYQNPHIL